MVWDRGRSTTVEIILYYLTLMRSKCSTLSTTVEIILYYLTCMGCNQCCTIYNSRNYSILLNVLLSPIPRISTTAEIFLYYLTGVSVYTYANLQQ